jgi:flavin-dependent dehydrogenase
VNEIDVIIIGAGPAGCAAAIRARQAGLSVMLFEANPIPKKSPGETLHPGIEPLFELLGIAEQIHIADFPRHSGVWLESMGLRQFIPYGEDNNGSWRGFQADRKILQQILQQAVIKSQANLIINVRPEQVILEKNRVAGIIAGGKAFRSKWTLDATGRYAWLARKLELSEIVCSPPLRVSFGWRNEILPDLDNQPCFTFHHNGWRWKAPIGGNQVAWTELWIGDSLALKNQPKGINVTWCIRPKSAELGFFLLGDAAAMLDPSSSHGVLRAIMSGIMAGHLLDGCFRGDISEKMAAEVYKTWLRELFDHDVIQLRQKYNESSAGKEFNRNFMI